MVFLGTNDGKPLSSSSTGNIDRTAILNKNKTNKVTTDVITLTIIDFLVVFEADACLRLRYLSIK